MVDFPVMMMYCVAPTIGFMTVVIFKLTAIFLGKK